MHRYNAISESPISAEKVVEKSMIPLNRRFSEWEEQDAPDADLRFRIGFPRGELTWADLLARLRVVLLAEAGSGKTDEMVEQARLLTAAGRFAFYATVEDVGQDGLENALDTPNRARLAAWRASHKEAWILIDTVDEAKQIGLRLEKSIRGLAEGIAGAERSAHVVLSGRITDWEFRRDLACLKDRLAVPNDLVLPPPLTPSEVLISTIRHQRWEGQAQTAEQPLVVLMAPLDPERVQLFATAKGARNLDALLAEIEAANLWRFAQRPLDLDWLVHFWQRHGRLGTLAEMLHNSLTERLNETNLGRARRDRLDVDRAFQAMERIGAALVFGQKATIAIPDSEVSLSTDNRPVNLAEVLPDWSPDDRIRLLTRPVFDPATFGRARLHNDNEGVVRGYLTARWLRRLRQANLSRESLFDLLFAETYGVELIKPSMGETAAWLSIWDEDIAREVARRDLVLLITAGDPGSLSADVRRSVLTHLVEHIARGDKQLPLLQPDSIRRFCRPDIANIVRDLWSKHQCHQEARLFLLRLIWIGELKDCGDLAAEATFEHDADPRTRNIASRAVIMTGDDATKRRYAEFINAEHSALPDALVGSAIEGLFPNHLTVQDLLGILKSVNITDWDGWRGFEWQSPNLVNRLNSRSELERLLSGLLELLGGEIGDLSVAYPLDKREQAYFPAIATAATRLLELCPDDEVPELAIDSALRLGPHRRGNKRGTKDARRLRRASSIRSPASPRVLGSSAALERP